MTPRKKKQINPFEQAIEAASSFVDDVQNVASDIVKIIEREPERAAHLFETFIAACHEKADEIDDSGGDFGALVEDLFLDSIKSRQVANHDADETAKLLLS